MRALSVPVLNNRDALTSDLKNLIKELDRLMMHGKSDEAKIKALFGERDFLNRGMVKFDEKSKKEMDKMEIVSRNANNSKAECAKWKRQYRFSLQCVKNHHDDRELDGAIKCLGLCVTSAWLMASNS